MGESVPQTGLKLTRSIVLIGMMGAGKTAIGRALAAELGVEIRDSDTEIVASAQLSIAEIFDRFGEPFFREKEGQVIARLLEGPPCVLSTGGGAWLSAQNREMLMAQASVVWLEGDLNLLWSRVKHKSHRPLLRTEDPKATLAGLLATRTPAYALAPAKVTVQPHWSIDRTAAEVMHILRANGTVVASENATRAG
ncbi:shikimate kinase [Hasllibacter sp. MH4015]|uniref:shikimate kinase n=1 Tax=Hasllibacter sp. MH4015 TaxID=2854029 RepID=UPI001CD59F5E|nr:shikimate kinase [Hasllibacter sp. MH4015]